jgi:heme O synthase-like polyprenyltransferase
MKIPPAAVSTATRPPRFAEQAAVYFELTKPRVVSLIVFTAVVGMLLATPGSLTPQILVFATLGISLAAGSAAAFNHVLDRRADALMARTRARPLPTHQLTAVQAVAFAAALAIVSAATLLLGVNTLTATPPHFWSLALYREKEYAKAGIPMLPVTHGSSFTRRTILAYTIVLAGVSLLPYATGMSGFLYLVGAVILNARFVAYAWQLHRGYSDALAWTMFRFSIQYLAALFALLLLDHYGAAIRDALQSLFVASLL